MLIQSLGGQIVDGQTDPTGAVAMLILETVRFRDKLKEEAEQILTVEDTRMALESLEGCLKGEEIPDHLTDEQKMLTRIWIDRLTIFQDS